jgi:hypothetical protein
MNDENIPSVGVAESALKIVTQAQKLLSGEGAFTKKAFARDADGIEVGYNSPTAVCYCTLGALYKVTDRHGAFGYLPGEVASEAVQLVYGKPNSAVMNDRKSTTQLQVLIAFDFARLVLKDQLKAARRAAK